MVPCCHKLSASCFQPKIVKKRQSRFQNKFRIKKCSIKLSISKLSEDLAYSSKSHKYLLSISIVLSLPAYWFNLGVGSKNNTICIILALFFKSRVLSFSVLYNYRALRLPPAICYVSLGSLHSTRTILGWLLQCSTFFQPFRKCQKLAAASGLP